MSDNVQSAMFEILKSVQASIAGLDQRVASLNQRVAGLDQRVAGLDQRMASVERGQAELMEMARKQRRDTAGMLVMMKGAVGIFEERFTALEQRVSRLEAERRT